MGGSGLVPIAAGLAGGSRMKAVLVGRQVKLTRLARAMSCPGSRPRRAVGRPRPRGHRRLVDGRRRPRPRRKAGVDGTVVVV